MIRPPRRHPNPPGRSQLSFRLGDQASFAQWMRGLIHQPSLSLGPDGPVLANPLSRLDMNDPGGFVPALLDAWAAVGDCLCFYQERIVNEGFLATATEDLSVHCLVHNLDVRAQPALSADTWLSFTLLDTREVSLPKGTSVQSIPPPGGTPQVFETNADLDARAEFNALTPLPPPTKMLSQVVAGATQLRISGGPAGLAAGMPLVFHGEAPSGSGETVVVRLLDRVEPDQSGGTTTLSWTDPLDEALPKSPEVTGFRQRAKLFGANAAEWAKQPLAVQAAVGTRKGAVAVRSSTGAAAPDAMAGLPPATVSLFAIATDGTVFAAMAETILRLGAAGWSAVATTPTRTAVTCLTAEPGRLYAGSAAGEALCSLDGGSSWFALGAPVGQVPPDKEAAMRLPAAPVRALVTTGGQVLAATPQGVWTAPANGGFWRASDLPAGTSVNDLLVGSTGAAAAADTGLYYTGSPPAGWKAASVPASAKGAAAFALACDQPSGTLYAATAAGILISTNGGATWNAAAALPSAATLVAADHGTVWAGGAGGLFQSTDPAQAWQPAEAPFAGMPVSALAAGYKWCAMAQPFAGFVETDWPGIQVQGTPGQKLDLYLDRAYPGLVPGGWLVLSQDGPGTVARRISDVAVEPHRAFGQGGRVSRVTVDPLPAAFDPRRCTAFLSSRAVAVPGIAKQNVAVLQDRDAIPVAGALDDLAGRLVAISGRRATARLVGQAGGVRSWNRASATWELAAPGNFHVHSLLATSDRRLLMGGARNVRALSADGSWARCGQLNQRADALAELDGAILAGTPGGVWRMAQGDGHEWSSLGLTDMRVRCLLVDGQGRVLAGTDKGLMAATLAKTGEPRWSTLVAGQPIRALALTAKGAVAATARGMVFVEREGAWRPAGQPPSARWIKALAVDSAGTTVWAGSNRGVFVSTDCGDTWQPDPNHCGTGVVRALAVDDDGVLWWSVQGSGVVAGNTLLPTGIANKVLALAVHCGAVHAGSSTATALVPEDGDGGRATFQPQFLAEFDSATLRSYLVEGPVGPELAALLAAHGATPGPDATVTPSPQGSAWTIGGTGPAVYAIYALPEPGAATQGYQLFLETVLETMAPVQTPDTFGALPVWSLRTAAGQRVRLTARADDVAVQPATAASEQVTEVLSIAVAEVADDRGSTTLTLDGPLHAVFDAATVVLSANLVPASHGESPVNWEVLGSGDASRRGQSFTLKRSPLSARLVDGQIRFDITVKVRPNQPDEPVTSEGRLRPRAQDDQAVEWVQVDSLANSGPNDPHYEIRTTSSGVTIVGFGDGVHGRRLPTGVENVIAFYRVGSGPAGNVAADSLSQPRKRPAGVRSVTNPLAARDGTAGESRDSLRARAPLGVRAFGRVVSATDYQDFALAFPGIAKALMRRLDSPEGPLVHVTVAVAEDGGDPIPGLTQALKANGGRARLLVQPARLVPFSLSAKIFLVPGASSGQVLDDVRAALGERYGFANRQLGDDVLSAGLIALVQSLPGVRAIHVDVLAREGWATHSVPDRLTAEPAHWGPDGQALAAELLVIAPDIQLIAVAS